MLDAGPGAHHLDVASPGTALVPHRILVSDRAGADIGHDLHVAMRMRRETALRCDLVVVPDAYAAPAHALEVMIVREGEMMARVEPSMVGLAEAVEGANVNHDADLARRVIASSVSDVTGLERASFPWELAPRVAARRPSMCDSDSLQPFMVDTSFTRRSVVLTISSVAAAAALPTAAFAAANVTETDVMVPTPDGSADAVLLHPSGSGSWPAVLMWPDILGLRPVFREMGHRLAAEGYTVLVPNPFYRTKRAPVVTGQIDFSDRKQVQPLLDLKATLIDAAIDKDATAFINFLDAQKQTDRRKGAGVQGY